MEAIWGRVFFCKLFSRVASGPLCAGDRKWIFRISGESIMFIHAVALLR
jgi:hypothetical protein